MTDNQEVLGAELLDAFVRLAQGDFAVRVPRNYKRDTSDTLAYFFNLLAEELGRVLPEREAMRQRLETGVAELSEAFLRFAAGDFEVRTQRTGNGDPLDVLGFLFDNTVAEVKDTFAELERQRSTMSAIFESISEGVFLLNRQGVIIAANRAASAMFGRTVAELEGQPLRAFLASREVDFDARLERVWLRKPEGTRDVYFELSGGQTVPHATSIAPVVNAEDEVTGLVVSARDDRSLRKTQAQLQLADRMATMGTLAAGVAHEINNPLSYVLSNLEYLEEELEHIPPGQTIPADLHREMFRALATSREGALRVSQIVRDLKSMSRAEEEELRPVELARVLDGAANMLRNDIRHRARLVKAYGETPPVTANEARILQVALNLIQNAAHAIPVGNVAEHQIFIETRTGTEGEAIFSITDTGSGIPADQLESIFDNFYTTKPVGQGTGLGLAICQRIIEELGGRIEVTSEVGRGSTFRVTLPAVHTPRIEMQTEFAPSAQINVRRRILVIDDERAIGESIQRLLRAVHRVDIATSGSEGLARFSEMPYDLVLIDLMMPEMRGTVVRDEITARYPHHRAVIALMSGGELSADEDLPGQHFVEKPVSRDVLNYLLEKVAKVR